VQPEKIQPGYVAHTLGYPVPSSMYGGGWIYGLSNNRVSIGLVIALEYADPRFDPHATFQKWKTNPFVANLLEGGKLVRYGAKSLPYGGWYACLAITLTVASSSAIPAVFSTRKN